MLGFGALGQSAVGEARIFRITAKGVGEAVAAAALSVSSLIIPEGQSHEGVLVRSTAGLWKEIVNRLSADWKVALELSPRQWEELVAGALKKAGYDEVTLTPRSRDLGRDVIAVKKGVGCVKIIGSVKAYKPGHLVGYDDIRALLGVLSAERDSSKGIIATTSDFPPKIASDAFIAPFLPTRLELLNGAALRKWLTDLAREQKAAT